MCGIAAIFAYRFGAPGVERDELIAIRDRMSHRGPDGEGIWISDDRRVGIAHRRLTIIDLSENGAQPMWNHDRTLCITFNGEIYNYRALRAQLSDRGYQFTSTSDTEVLLHLYADRGAEMMHELRGMYAFAIWDREKEGIFLARDPFGIKPLYYSDNGHTFRLASQVKPLRESGHIDLAPDPAGHVGYFLWGHVPDPYTLYRNIRSLPAGNTMWVDQSGPRSPKTFCNITTILREAEESEVRGQKSEVSQQISDSQHFSVSDFRAERLRAALADTVRHHLVADVPVGVFLSAGLDSTTIAALAAEQGGILRTVTLGFEEYKSTPSDETPLAEQFAKRCGAEHQTIWVSRADFEAERDHLFEAMDRPSTDGVNTFFVSLAAKQANLKVALSGVGGDELFASYPSFKEIPRTVGFLKAFRHWGNFGAGLRVLSGPVLKQFTSPKYAGMFEYGGTYSGAYLLRRGMFMPWELPELLDPELVRAGWQELQTLVRLDETLDNLQNPRLKVSALEMSWYMRHQLLRDSDWAGMGHSVEIRVPFVDVDFLKSIAPLLAGKHPPTKRDMAASASKFVTPEILERPKTGFQIPVRKWLLTDLPTYAADPSRGLRGWAKHVYRHFPGAQLRDASRRGRKTEKLKAEKLKSDSSSEISAFQSVSISAFREKPKRILIFRIGQLGDTIVSLPAMWAVRRNFPNVHLALLCDRHPGKEYVLASDLLRGAGIFDEFLSYPVAESGEILRGSRMAALLTRIRSKRFDTLVYLAPSGRKSEQIERDRRFFSMAGIRNFIGMQGFETLEAKEPGRPLKMVQRESELLLQRLAASGLTIGLPVAADQISASPSRRSLVAKADQPFSFSASSFDLGLGPDDDATVLKWLADLHPDGDRVWIAVGPGSKMPAKRWPLERFRKVIGDLIEEFDVWPIIFGGEEDRVIGKWLLDRWGRGYNAAGELGLRSSFAAMKRCRLFVGNDTGTMHMAAAAGVSCVAIFSSRAAPGRWFPSGEGHRVFYSHIECEGCGLVECIERQNECLKRIAVTEVLEACGEILRNKLESKRAEIQLVGG